MKSSGMKTQCIFSLAFLIAAAVLTVNAFAVSVPADCTGYCSALPAITCSNNTLQCCCNSDTTAVPVWTCVCKLPTDCNKANSCQDPG